MDGRVPSRSGEKANSSSCSGSDYPAPRQGARPPLSMGAAPARDARSEPASCAQRTSVPIRACFVSGTCRKHAMCARILLLRLCQRLFRLHQMILITGGAGFIGSNFVVEWLRRSREPTLVVDKLTYAG